MKAYTWKELNELWRGWVSAGLLSRSKSNPLRAWILGFPLEAQKAAAVAMSMVKWHPDNSDLRNPHWWDLWTCGCCLLYAPPPNKCTSKCALYPVCVPSSDFPGETYNYILGRYREAYAELPAEWKEQPC